jgi:hypothetical protein
MARNLRLSGEVELAALLQRRGSQKPFRLEPDEVPEGDALPAILRALELHPRVAWAHRMNTGAGRFLLPDGSLSRFVRYGFPGMSDITGQLIDGRRLEVEVKRVGKEPTDDQAAFLDCVRRNGGVAFVARYIDDVQRELKEQAP